MGELDLARVRALAFRLAPGEDLRAALEERARGLRAACVVSCVGSLTRARLRMAGGERVEEVEGPLEIVSLVGTLSPEGAHLHVALADGEGRVVGGHVVEGCVVYTTAEVVLGALDGVEFGRATDPATGWRELVVRRGTRRRQTKKDEIEIENKNQNQKKNRGLGGGRARNKPA